MILFCLLITFSNRGFIRGNLDAIQEPQPVENLLYDNLDSLVQRRGTWYLGPTPPNLKESVRPIVFVQGLKGTAGEWWGKTDYHGANDMLELAYRNGYRTAFVELYDPGQGPLTQFDNGKLLAEMLEKISGHFGEKVNIFAHSKGGVDSQTACTYYDAHRFVDKIITVASPHHGTHLANLFYSWYGHWIVRALGAEGPGTMEMQTATMAKFREATDHHPNISKNKYYTASGTNWGPKPSILWCGGFYLSQFGANDGLINEESTHLPYATHLFTEGLDHDLLRKGSAVWDKIEPILNDKNDEIVQDALSASLSDVWAQSGAKVEDLPSSETENDQYITGGEIARGRTVEKEVVLDNPRQALFTVYTSSPDVMVSVQSPTGRTYTRECEEYTSYQEQELLPGATAQFYSIPQPEVGKWRVLLTSRKTNAYLLTTSLIGKHTFSLTVPSITKMKEVPLCIRMNEKVDPSMQVRIKMIGPDHTTEERELIVHKAGGKNLLEGNVPIGKKRGLYNVLFEFRKKSGSGIIERTVSRSIYIR